MNKFKHRTFKFKKIKSRHLSDLNYKEMQIFVSAFNNALYKAVEKQFEDLVEVKPL